MALARVIAFKPQCRFDRRQMSQEFVDVFFQKRLDEEMFDCSFKEWVFYARVTSAQRELFNQSEILAIPSLRGTRFGSTKTSSPLSSSM
jgi:hypothetical protein